MIEPLAVLTIITPSFIIANSFDPIRCLVALDNGKCTLIISLVLSSVSNGTYLAFVGLLSGVIGWQCLIHFFTKTSFKYCFKVTNSVFNKLYNDLYNDFAVISIAWSWFSCKSNLSAFFIKNTSSYSFNSMSKVYVSSAFVIQFIMLFITFTWCSMIDSLTTLIMTKAYIVDSFYKVFANVYAKNNSNACSFTLKHHVLVIMFKYAQIAYLIYSRSRKILSCQ